MKNQQRAIVQIKNRQKGSKPKFEVSIEKVKHAEKKKAKKEKEEKGSHANLSDKMSEVSGRNRDPNIKVK